MLVRPHLAYLKLKKSLSITVRTLNCFKRFIMDHVMTDAGENKSSDPDM